MDGQSATALGYIGNIHPSRHSELYTIIEELVARFSSLWDRVLTDLHPDNPVLYRITDSYEWEESKYSAPQEEDFNDYGEWRYELKCWRKSRQVIRPTVEAVYPEDISKRKAVYSVTGRKIQVFVRAFDIILVSNFLLTLHCSLADPGLCYFLRRPRTPSTWVNRGM